MKFTQLAALAAIGALALTSCSGDDDNNESDKSPDGAETSGVISPSDLPSDPKLQKPVGIIDDTDVEQCPTEPGKAEAHGAVTNSAKQAKDLVITINWTVGSGDVVARGIAKLKDVAPGDTKDWSVEATLPDESGIQCVPSAQAGTLK